MFHRHGCAEAFYRIQDTVDRMLQGATTLKHVDLRLFVGCRDYMNPDVTAYQRAMVSYTSPASFSAMS